MAKKKDRGRFTIKFNENDPAHEAVIDLLERQGPHSKAQFIANAILHYVHCRETPDIGLSQPTVDRASIEVIVLSILNRQGIGPEPAARRPTAPSEENMAKPVPPQEPDDDGKSDEKLVDDDTMSLIADTLSAFRNN